MVTFKTISSISTDEEKLILKYCTKGLQIQPDKEKIGEPIPGYDANSINPNLDDIIGAVEDQYKLKNLDDSRLPDELDELEPLPGGRLQPEDNFLNKILWKYVIPKVQPGDFDLTYKKARALRVFCLHMVVKLLKSLLKQFINLNLKKLAVTKINKHYHNGKLVAWLNEKIQEVYDSNPNYIPLSIHEFKKTSIWARNAAEWRDKNRKQIIRRLSKRMFTIIILILCTKVPLPGSFLYSIPARIILAYAGCHLAVGSIYTLVVEHGKNSVILGITLTKYGYELTNPELIVRRKSDKKIVRVPLPDIPRELYQMTEEDYIEIEKEGFDIEQVKKEVAVINDKS